MLSAILKQIKLKKRIEYNWCTNVKQLSITPCLYTRLSPTFLG